MATSVGPRRSSPGSTRPGWTTCAARLACSAGETIVRVLPDGPIDKTFDYVVPARLAPLAAVGTQVRVPLHGRRVSGWIVDIDVSPPAGVSLAELIAVRGMGPPPEVIALAAWAAHRWAGRTASVLTAASPPALVSRLPPPLMGTVPTGGGVADLPPEALHAPGAVVRLPPPVDHLPLILAAARLGPALVVTPSVGMARALAARVRRAGVGVAMLPRDWAQASGWRGRHDRRPQRGVGTGAGPGRGRRDRRARRGH